MRKISTNRYCILSFCLVIVIYKLHKVIYKSKAIYVPIKLIKDKHYCRFLPTTLK